MIGSAVAGPLPVFLAAQDASVDVMYTWETFNAKYGKTLFVDVTDTFKKPLLDGLTPASKKAGLDFIPRSRFKIYPPNACGASL